MKVGLIDVDSHNFPNLSLMKISAFHKLAGDTVEFVQWYQEEGETVSAIYDRVYMSKVFSESKEPTGVIRCQDVRRGGSGYDLKNALPDEIEHIYPDYSLYPEYTKDTAYGWLTRGCPRCNHSTFCITPEKDGRKAVKVADLSEFWNGQKNIVLYDQNILACKDRMDLLEQLAESGASVEFNGGMDVRFLNDEVIEMLRRVKVKDYHFAWDDPRENLIDKFKEFAESGLKKTNQVGVYVLVNHWSTHFEDLYRIYTLRALGFMPFVMIYDKQKFVDSNGRWLKGVEAKYTREEMVHFKICQHMQRWCGNRKIIKSTPNFDQYENFKKWKEAGMPVPGFMH